MTRLQSAIDFLTNRGVCMADSERPNREMVHVQSREGKESVSSALFPMSVAWDNNDVKPTMDVTSSIPHAATFMERSWLWPLGPPVCCGVMWGNYVLYRMDEVNAATLPGLARREDFLPTEDVTVDMVVNGLHRHEDRSTSNFKGFGLGTSLLEIKCLEECMDSTHEPAANSHPPASKLMLEVSVSRNVS